MFALGITLGLLAALAQSFAYLASRWYTVGRDAKLLQLLALSHVYMGVTCLPLAVLLLPGDLPPASRWLLQLAGVSVFYVLGQVGLFVALRYTDASRVSPMLGLKVVLLAVIVAALGGHLTPLQWTAVGLTVLGAFALNYSGGSLPFPAVAALLSTCACYSVSDTCILLMIDAMTPVPRLHASMFGLCIVYVVVGVMSAPLLPLAGSRRPGDWVAALPFSGAWLAAMAFLFACFGLLTGVVGPEGVVLGNILQATRGVISLALAVLVVRLGHEHLERRVSASVFWRRVAAAGMMLAAIALFNLEGIHDDAGTGSEPGTVDQGGHDRSRDDFR